MKTFKLLALCSLTLGTILSCSYARHENTKSESDTLTARIDSLVNPIFEENGPGGVVLVMQGDSVLYGKGFGMARLDSAQRVDLNTMFNICSISKQFAAAGLLKLAEQGKLSLDDNVIKYFPQLSPEVYKDVTLRHLLSHTSGIPDSRPRTPGQWAEYRKRFDSEFSCVEDFARLCREDESLRYLEGLESLSFTPGSQYEYMNPTFQMMLSIIEQASSEDFDTWMRENIFLPAGMTRTTYFEEHKFIPDMAHGYQKNDSGQWEEYDYGEANFFGTKADGALYTSAREFALWDKALFGDKILNTSSREEAHTGHIDTDIPFTQYGYGWFIEQRPDRPLKIFHTGDNGGFLTFAGRFPEKDIFYLIFSTHPHWDREATVDSLDNILQEIGILD